VQLVLDVVVFIFQQVVVDARKERARLIVAGGERGRHGGGLAHAINAGYKFAGRWNECKGVTLDGRLPTSATHHFHGHLHLVALVERTGGRQGRRFLGEQLLKIK
jgi:hypothetical protein